MIAILAPWLVYQATGRMAFLFAIFHDKPPQECINKQPQMLCQKAPPYLSKQIQFFDFLFMSSKYGMLRNFYKIGSFIFFHVCIWPPFHFECFHALAVNLFRMHLPVDQAATASSESLALGVCFTPDTHGILSGILWEPLCLGHAKAKTPQRRAKSRRRTGWAAGSKLRRIAGCVASRGGWRLSGSRCSND